MMATLDGLLDETTISAEGQELKRLEQQRERFTQRFIQATTGRSEFARLASELEQALQANAHYDPIPPHKQRPQ